MRLRLLHLLGVGMLVLAGCAGYRLGPPSGIVAGDHTIQVMPFGNKTMEPRLPEYVMISLRKNLQQNGGYRLDTHDDGDLILEGTIVNYQRSILSVQAVDVLTPVNYDILMTAHVTIRERSSGKIIFDKNVTGRTAVSTGADLTSAERQAMPLLTDDLARKAVAMLVDGAW